MPRVSFERELQRLEGELLELGDTVENAITESVQTLKKRDLQGSQSLVDNDRLINKRRYAIEADVLILIATQQPVAGDLRILAAILDITHELERIGDYAKGIAKISLRIGKGRLIKPLIDIPRMAEKAASMLHRGLDAFIRRDTDLARTLPSEDDEVDGLYNQVYRELMTHILADPKNIEGANSLLGVAHNLERAADRVTNICERVIFTVAGEVVELDT